MTTSNIEGGVSSGLENSLLRAGVATQEGIGRAKALSRDGKISFDRALLKLGLVEEATLLPLLAASMKLRFFGVDSEIDLDFECLNKLGLTYCQANLLVPVLSSAEGRLVLTADPAKSEVLHELRFYLGGEFELGVAPTQIIRSRLATVDAEEEADQEGTSERLKADRATLESLEVDGPVIRFVAEVLESAVASGASDIHFEALEDRLRIRERIHGVLIERSVAAALAVSAVLARVKVMAGMNVSERRLPQDGRISINLGGRKVDFRVSTVPTIFGESIVCRILDPRALRLGWERLGFEDALSKKISRIVAQPNGLFLVTGPTGSGKTTTLYTILSQLNNEKRKILTVEDPIEYSLPGIEQVQVHEEIGMTFPRALRSFLRQDPNIIMVGEIRDQETAEIACRAALVGRMVLSTLHTNSPEGAMTRLLDLGVPEYIAKEVLRGVLGQRLEVVDGAERRLVAHLVEF